MSNFGGLTDHFGLATDHMVLVSSTATPVSQSRADALDENGDIAASAWHGNTSAGLEEATCVYALKSGTLPTGFELGQLSVGVVVLSIAVATSNGEWPQITVSGIIGSEALEQIKTYALGTLNVSGKKQAQAMGVALTTGKLTDCTLTATCDWAQQEDGLGEPVAYGVSGAIASADATAVGTGDAAPVLAAAAGYTVSQGSGKEEGQAAWHTASITTEKILSVSIAGS